LVVVLAAGACSTGGSFPDRTARVTISGHTTDFTVTSCGRDGQTGYVVGHAADGSVVQAVIGVRKDHHTGVPESTGVSVIDDPHSVEAFGPESWSRLRKTGPAPGTVTSDRIKGARLQAEGTAQPVDSHDDPTDAKPVPFSFDARCDKAS
jgi:hypothetical protein